MPVQMYQLYGRPGWYEELGLLTDPESAFYVPYFSQFFIMETVGNTLMLVLSLLLVPLFFLQKRVFPKVFAFYLVFSFLFLGADVWGIKHLFPLDELSKEATRDIAYNALGVLIWVPYMRVSARVKNTFIQ